jgi:glutaredoxin
MTNITSNQLIIGNQRKLKHILDTNKIAYVDIDISDSKNSTEKQFLQRTMASLNQQMVLPQIFRNDQYCCDFDGLISAVESNTVKQVLKLDQANGN